MPGLYIHVPFCIKKCYYCDFPSAQLNPEDADRYLKGLEAEMEFYRESLGKLRPETIFIGGGTPTCLQEGQLAMLLELCRKYFAWEQYAEVTVEANPGTLTPAKLVLLREGGVNRISLGVQAFQDRLLEGIGRIHRGEDVYRSVEMIRGAGFGNLNLDLIFALPGQTMVEWQDSLLQALDLQPEHLAVYSLKVEEGTPFGDLKQQGFLKPAGEDLELAMYKEAIEFLIRAGYNHYEISNFTRTGFESTHNLTYWNNREYLGLGPGAWSFMNHKRYSNIKDLDNYLEVLEQGKQPLDEVENLDQKTEMSETVFMGLRKLEGLDMDSFSKRFGVGIETQFSLPLEKLIKFKMLEIVNNRLRLTPQGLPIANEIFTHFLL